LLEIIDIFKVASSLSLVFNLEFELC